MSQRSWVGTLCRQERLPDDYARAVDVCVAPLAARIAKLRQVSGAPIVVGVCGAQGTGKTTLALFLEYCLREEAGVRATTLALDDLYLPKQAREALAQSRHRLFATRGVPGTHDLALGHQLLDALTGHPARVAIPVFDKAADDRGPPADCRVVEAPVDVVVFEGWCVGASAQPDEALLEPVNALEADEDPDGAWRRHVNHRLQSDYALLFDRLDALVYLHAPSFEKVFEWRALQEAKLLGAADSEKLRRFVSHFERLTRHIAAEMPQRADAVVRVGEDHRLGRPKYPDGTRLR